MNPNLCCSSSVTASLRITFLSVSPLSFVSSILNFISRHDFVSQQRLKGDSTWAAERGERVRMLLVPLSQHCTRLRHSRLLAQGSTSLIWSLGLTISCVLLSERHRVHSEGKVSPWLPLDWKVCLHPIRRSTESVWSFGVSGMLQRDLGQAQVQYRYGPLPTKLA